jgi:hypothetical protein
MKNLPTILLFGLVTALCSCDPDDDDNTVAPPSAQGYKPVYATETAPALQLLAPRTIATPKKIYRYGDYLLVSDLDVGIHVFDNKNPEAPAALGFIPLSGNTDVSVQDGVLYANHAGNLLAIRVENFATLVQTRALPFSQTAYTHLYSVTPPKGYYFECIDPEKGSPIGWEQATLQNPACYALH